MTSCPDCYSQIGSMAKHRQICLVRNNKRLKTWLESIEFWLRRMESHLSQSYKNVARYAYIGRRDADRQEAAEEHKLAQDMEPQLPKLLAQLSGYTCERTNLAQLRANIVRNQMQELRVMLRNL